MRQTNDISEQLKETSGSSRMKVILLLIGIIMIAMTLRAPITSVGPLIETIRSDMGMSHTLVSLLTTFPLLAFALLSPVAPKIARKWGIERTLFVGVFAVTAGIVLRYLPSIITLFAGTILLGLGIALSNVLLPSLIKRDFPNKVGVMMGTYSVSMNIFAALASGISIPLAESTSAGWRGSLVMWGILSFAALLIWLPQIRSIQKQAPNVQVSAKSNVWRSKLAWQVTIVMGLQSFIFYSVVAWLPEILTQRGMSASTAGWMLSLMQFFSVPVTFVVPILAVRFKNQRGLVLATFACFIIGLLLLLSGSRALVPLAVIAVGIGTGAAFGLVTMFFVLRSRSVNQSAELSGMAQSIGYLLAAAGPLLFGFVHDLTGSWTSAIVLLIVVSVIYVLAGWGAGNNRFIGEEYKKKTSVS